MVNTTSCFLLVQILDGFEIMDLYLIFFYFFILLVLVY